MKNMSIKTLGAALVGVTITLTPALGMAHCHHQQRHKIVIVKPATPTKVTVIKQRRPCRGYWHRGYWRCDHHPGRVLTHAVADAIWWESTH
ncbi:MAG TPA: hypothetical protein ENG92_03950 [Thiolapillus brandeum]|uniref:DUF3761 domain-containing protein n=1 Tax=Thiolapillus brandeum TaxID=1076588 RepID=A0A831KC75_9GAMM|nr:hypothetical protein [Thiolapillus brandeum]